MSSLAELCHLDDALQAVRGVDDSARFGSLSVRVLPESLARRRVPLARLQRPTDPARYILELLDRHRQREELWHHKPGSARQGLRFTRSCVAFVWVLRALR